MVEAYSCYPISVMLLTTAIAYVTELTDEDTPSRGMAENEFWWAENDGVGWW